MMESLALLLGSSWASGINLYLTVAGLGLAHRLQWIILPGSLDQIAHPLVIVTALILYAIEFFADKVPYVDSAWDSVHTFIRPVAAAGLGYMAVTGEVSMPVQVAVTLLTGGIALDAHLTKATARAAINATPEPVSNVAASVSEDVSVLGALYLMMTQPVALVILVLVFIIASVFFLKAMVKFLRHLFQRRAQRGKEGTS